MGILASFQAVLTLPGIAGMVLTLGMAVDANVLIYERTKEELRAGKSLNKAIADGYSNAFSAIFDSNLTSIITGVVLFYFGTGPIRGFATTMIIGLFASFLTAVFLTRIVYEALLAKDKLKNVTFTTSITKDLLTNPKINFLAARKVGYLIPAGIIVLGAISMSTIGLNNGIDFTGGRNYVIRFAQDVKTDEVRNLLMRSWMVLLALSGSVLPTRFVYLPTIRLKTMIRLSTRKSKINCLKVSSHCFRKERLFGSVHGSVYPELTEGRTEYGRRYQERCVSRSCICHVLYGGLYLASFPRHLILCRCIRFVAVTTLCIISFYTLL